AHVHARGGLLRGRASSVHAARPACFAGLAELFARLARKAAAPARRAAASPRGRTHAEVGAERPRERRGGHEAVVERDLEHAGVGASHQRRTRALEAQPLDEGEERLTGHGLEDAIEVEGRERRHPSQLRERQSLGEMPADVVDDAVDAPVVLEPLRRPRPRAQYLLAIGSSSAGNSVMICAPAGVTITSSSMRAAEMPSVAGQYVSTANIMPACSSMGSSNEFSRLMIGRSCRPRPMPWQKFSPNAAISLSKPISGALGKARAILSVVTPGLMSAMASSIHSRAFL